MTIASNLFKELRNQNLDSNRCRFYDLVSM
jgi:hypothetical protein